MESGCGVPVSSFDQPTVRTAHACQNSEAGSFVEQMLRPGAQLLSEQDGDEDFVRCEGERDEIESELWKDS